VVGAGISALRLQVTHRTVLMQLVSFICQSAFCAGQLRLTAVTTSLRNCVRPWST
jgi:hypothetical protein